MHDMEFELENEFEMERDPFAGDSFADGEFEDHEAGLLGEGPYGETAYGETAYGESENELFGGDGFGEYEGEGFLLGPLLKKAVSGVGGWIKKNSGTLKQLAAADAPIIGNAVAGPVGQQIGECISKALGENAGQGEYEFEFESESEGEGEFESVMSGPLSAQQGMGEYMASIAANAQTDTEAEAQIGASVIISLSPADRDALRSLLPSITRGAAILTRLLRHNRRTRPVVRVVPTIVKRTAVALKKRSDAGQPITKKTAAKVMAAQTKRVIGSPTVCARAMQRNLKASTAVARPSRPSRPALKY
jgi:hypothetical protein